MPDNLINIMCACMYTCIKACIDDKKKKNIYLEKSNTIWTLLSTNLDILPRVQ